jgi:hypothetical protein
MFGVVMEAFSADGRAPRHNEDDSAAARVVVSSPKIAAVRSADRERTACGSWNVRRARLLASFRGPGADASPAGLGPRNVRLVAPERSSEHGGREARS